ncbi:hypothetical protein VitviT2T_014561 [Vitis vinifera]|uniref:LysM domain receptor-like kinase 3 n=1 Tax=Vitis vinifera TaxID=29760 RepID=A0ABY9CKW0_VITVI|nr:hypothetical protein VitviT2T_014561 [Vitis vinifera]
MVISSNSRNAIQILAFGFHFLVLLCSKANAKCSRGCDLALASYYVWDGSNLTYIRKIFGREISEILKYNPQIENQDSIDTGSRINVPFRCDCLNGDFLGHTFEYTTQFGDTYDRIAERAFSNLTTEDWVHRVNEYPPTRIPDDVQINVTVNCSCGNRRVSMKYGLFATYPLRDGENLSTVAAAAGITDDLVRRYNPAADFSAGTGLVFVPAKDQNETYPPLKLSNSGISSGVIAGISVAGIVGSLLFAFFLFARICKRKKVKKVLFFPAASEQQYMQHRQAHGSASEETSDSAALVGAASLGLVGITVDKSVEFSYEELATATDNFSLANKIGQGGFGSVYYAELRGEKAAIKKMDMQASKEFLAELKVLTHVHHLNLVRLIGYCVEGSLFLVYEFIDNGNLSHHLRGSGKDPLPWSSRVQIALDSARGLEYIHEHTVPVYIHRDIKPANILIDKKFRAKVADFGLTKLTEVGSASIPTRLVGTFGYMPPEYAQYGDVSPKIDVFAFGVVLYELISAKEAIVKTNEPIMPESKGLVALFEDVLSQPDPREDFVKLIDQRLGDDYPLDSIWKMAHLAKACTQENPQLRPSMRSIVVALMTLSSSTEDWDVGSFYENEALMNLMSGSIGVESKCSRGCDLALASYNIWNGTTLSFIATAFSTSISEIQSFNPQINDIDLIIVDTRLNIPFSCSCIDGEFLGHTFFYSVDSNDTYNIIARTFYANLTTVEWLERFNRYEATEIPVNAIINVTVNCSCGNSRVSKKYGLFVTYPLQPGESLSSIANESGLPSKLLQDYNPGVDFSLGSGLVFIPGKDQNGSYPPLKLSQNGISVGVIAGISVAGVAGSLLLAFVLYVGIYKRKMGKAPLLPAAFEDQHMQPGQGYGSTLEKTSDSVALVAAVSLELVGITADKSVEFTYEELAKATNNFSAASKIGQGGFALVYYAELQGQKAAIKKMDMQASKEFLAELKVLTHVHHFNLVRLIGYCVTGSLFIVYEYIENGNLSQHLRGSGNDPLPWSTRVQIALDAARGLEYIHEHTVPVYVHRDIKSANILIDKNLRAKVADFGLTKLTVAGSSSLPTRLVGTFGYMPPEYAQFGAVTPKIDVYAFGVVLYELISAKEAIIKTNGSTTTEARGLVALFENVLSWPDLREDFCELIDHRLGNDYPLDLIWKMAQLAKACTQEDPQLRPSMQSVVVALMTLSSSTEDWDVRSVYENKALVNLMSGR